MPLPRYENASGPMAMTYAWGRVENVSTPTRGLTKPFNFRSRCLELLHEDNIGIRLAKELFGIFP